MTLGPRQIPLALPHETAFDRESFFASACNAAGLSAIERWPAWAARTLLLVGPSGSGKTHLAHLWAQESRALIWPAHALEKGKVPELLARGALVLEDLDRVPVEEEAFFHLLNAAGEARTDLLVTSRIRPEAVPLRLADLRSRLCAMPLVQLEPADDALLRTVLVKLFADRQLAPDPSVVAYLALRMERSLSAAAEIVAALDRRALAEKRPITRALAAEILRDFSGES
jgi:chromosomal replication initiation ATPase DnaA